MGSNQPTKSHVQSKEGCMEINLTESKESAGM